MTQSDESLAGHTLDEEGEHDEDGCWRCLHKQTVEATCRCGECCRRLIIEVLLEDAEREPRIAELGSPIYHPAELTASGQRELIGYLLNTGKDRACVFLDQKTDLCTIHGTRPLLCRLFNCDGEDREHLVQLGILPPRDGK